MPWTRKNARFNASCLSCDEECEVGGKKGWNHIFLQEVIIMLACGSLGKEKL